MATSPTTTTTKESDLKTEEPKAPESKTPEVKATAPAAVMIRAVHGRMVDPTTGLEFTQVPSELFKKSSWVQSQIDAGKLELVQD